MRFKFAVVTAICCLIHIVSAQAQESILYNKKHVNTVNVGTSLKYYWSSISVSRGYAFGNGLYLGTGIGIDHMSGGIDNHKNSIFIPIFADIKYSFINRKVSPFVGFKGGVLCDCTSSGIGYMLMPSIGLDLWKFSISTGFEMRNVSYRVETYDNVSDNIYGDLGPVTGHSGIMIGNNRLKLTLSYTF